MSRRVLVVLVGVTVLGGCAGPVGGTRREVGGVAGVVTAVRLDTSAGGVTVRGSAHTTKATVRSVVRYRAGAPRGRTYGIERGTLTLRGCGRQCSVDYTVDVPAGVAVTGHAEAGAIRLARVGRVGVTTEAGAVDVTSAGGPVVVRTVDGAIAGHRLGAGPVRARTENGPVALAVTEPVDVRAETANGGIRLTVPRGRYRVSARVGSAGERSIGVPNDPSAAHRLDLTTGNGDIDVTTR